MINTLNKTKQILNKYSLIAKKKFGQNFLVDDNILENIKNLGEVKPDELIIEIGPGLGNLTEYLKDYNLLLIEIDNDMIQILEERFNISSTKNIDLINEDVLNVNLDEIIKGLEEKNNLRYRNVKVIANLPYYITSPIIFKLLEDSKRVTEIIAMVQEEVADRIVAKNKNKNYGVLTVLINFWGIATKKIKVERNCFVPAPNVTSAVVKITKYNELNDLYKENIDYTIFKELVHKAFLNRRKKMLNSLYINNFMGLEKVQIEEIFNNCGISINSRAEELTLKEYIDITKMLAK